MRTRDDLGGKRSGSLFRLQLGRGGFGCGDGVCEARKEVGGLRARKKVEEEGDDESVEAHHGRPLLQAEVGGLEEGQSLDADVEVEGDETPAQLVGDVLGLGQFGDGVRDVGGGAGEAT